MSISEVSRGTNLCDVGMGIKQEPSEEPMVSSWRPPLCKRAIGSEKSFSIRLVFSVESCKMASKTKGQFVPVGFITNWNF